MSHSNLYSPTKTSISVRVTHTALQARSAPQFVKTHVFNAEAQTASSSTNKLLKQFKTMPKRPSLISSQINASQLEFYVCSL